jgi:hypothetical protein
MKAANHKCHSSTSPESRLRSFTGPYHSPINPGCENLDNASVLSPSASISLGGTPRGLGGFTNYITASVHGDLIGRLGQMRTQGVPTSFRLRSPVSRIQSGSARTFAIAAHSSMPSCSPLSLLQETDIPTTTSSFNFLDLQSYHHKLPL